jgi:ABC-2 type transport system ATP-binding protein
MEESNGIVIQIENLGKSYNGVDALKSLDLTVRKNSIFGFLGPNGAGKTTTIKLLLGLIRPTTGGGEIFGQDIVRESVSVRARIGYLPQDFRFYEHMTSRETLDYTAKFFFKGPQSEIDKRVDEMLDLVGLSDKADRPIKGFSGGERQRLGIAQAEVNYPELLILDEPAASLDPMGRRDILEVMNRIRKYATIFYCTHILDDVQRVSDTVAILNKGALIKQASIDELLAGTGETVYSVTVTGEADKAFGRVSSIPWVSEIQTSEKGRQTLWEISVTDETAAEDQLLSEIMSGGEVKVADFGLKAYSLEDIFMDLVEGEAQ